MSAKEMTVTSIGAYAAQVLDQGGPATIHGITSRGCFLLVRSCWVLFLTSEILRGPLSLNLQGEAGGLQEVSPGTPVEIRAGLLEFGARGVRVDLSHAERWKPSERPASWLSTEARRKRQVEVGKLLLGRQIASGSNLLLSKLLGLPCEGELPEASVFPYRKVEELQTSLGRGDSQRIVEILKYFLGRGPGLTPSGDDLVVGLLLALRRWGDVLLPGLDLSKIYRELLPMAYRKTSTLAANLIECAAAGQADERLVIALDGLMVGEPNPRECAELLLDYGSSSGCDSFVGMSLTLD